MADIQTQLPVKGSLTNNNAAPTTNNVGVLPVLANASAPLWIEGNQVLLSTDLTGNLRVLATSTGTGNVNLTEVGGVAIALGQTIMANSFPVVISSDQSDLNVVGTLTNNNAAPVANNIGVLPVLANASAPLWIEGNQVLLSTDLTGNLRVVTSGTSAFNLTQVGGSAIALGQTTMANSFPVVIASDQSAIPVTFGEASTGIVAYYQTASSVANASTGTVTYTVTGGMTFYLKQIMASSSGGPCRVQVDYGAGPTIICISFYSTSAPYFMIAFEQPIEIAAGTAVNIKIMNNVGFAQDVYGFIGGHEI